MSYEYTYLKDLNAGDIAQFTAWFERNNLDFVLSHTSAGWRCTSWARNKGRATPGIQSWSSGVCASPTVAFHACYNAVREAQRASA